MCDRRRSPVASQAWKPLIALPETGDAEEWLQSLVRPTGWELKVAWPDFEHDVRDHVERILSGQMGRAGKEGRFAHLAYVVLGHLLDNSPCTSRVQEDGDPAPASHDGSSFLGRASQGLDQVETAPRDRDSRHRPEMAAVPLPRVLDPALRPADRGSPARHRRDQGPRCTWPPRTLSGAPRESMVSS